MSNMHGISGLTQSMGISMSFTSNDTQPIYVPSNAISFSASDTNNHEWSSNDMSLVSIVYNSNFAVVAADSRSTFISRNQPLSYQDNYKKIVQKGACLVAATGLNSFNGRTLEQVVETCKSEESKPLTEELIQKIQPAVSAANISANIAVIGFSSNILEFRVTTIPVDSTQTNTHTYPTVPNQTSGIYMGEAWAIEYLKKIPANHLNTSKDAVAFLENHMYAIMEMDKECLPNSIGGTLHLAILQPGETPKWWI